MSLPTWDAANRLVSSQSASQLSAFSYDGLGNRVAQTVGATTTNYALDVALGLAEIIFTSEGQHYLHLPGVIMTQAQSQTRYLLSDGLGSIRQATDELGQVVATASYDPYGNPLGGQESGYGYTGEPWLAELGLLHLRARWYDPSTATFLSRDSVETEHPYAYVRGNPVNFTDPSGMCSEFGDSDCWAIYEKIIALCPDCALIKNPSFTGDKILHEENSYYLNQFLGTLKTGWRPLVASTTNDAVRIEANRYGVPWEVVEGVLESEITLDTQWWDYLETAIFRSFPILAGLRPDPGPGIGNVHFSTAKRVSQYFSGNYSSNSSMQPSVLSSNKNWEIALRLTNEQFNIRVVAAIVRQLADYRFGANEQPLKQDHSSLKDWTMTDAVAVWHGFRYGVPNVSYGGIGFKTVADFQNSCYLLDQLIEVAQGPGAEQSLRDSIPIFQQYNWGDKDRCPCR